jgi:hypothetical protein
MLFKNLKIIILTLFSGIFFIVHSVAHDRSHENRTIDDIKSEIEQVALKYEQSTELINTYFDDNISFKNKLYNFIIVANTKRRNNKKDLRHLKKGNQVLLSMCNSTDYEQLQAMRERSIQRLNNLFEEYLIVREKQWPVLDKFIPDEEKKNKRFQMLLEDYSFVTGILSGVDKSNVRWDKQVEKAETITEAFNKDISKIQEWIANKPENMGEVALKTRENTENLLIYFISTLENANLHLNKLKGTVKARIDLLKEFEQKKNNYLKKKEQLVIDELNKIDRFWKMKTEMVDANS